MADRRYAAPRHSYRCAVCRAWLGAPMPSPDVHMYGRMNASADVDSHVCVNPSCRIGRQNNTHRPPPMTLAR